MIAQIRRAGRACHFFTPKIAAKPQKSAIFSKFYGQNRAIFIIFAVFGPKTRFLGTAHKPHKIVAHITTNRQRKTNRTEKNHRHPITKPHPNKKNKAENFIKTICIGITTTVIKTSGQTLSNDAQNFKRRIFICPAPH